MVKHYAFFKAPDYSSMNELFNGFHWTTRPLLPTDAFLEKQIWAEDFQQNLRKAIEFGLKGHKTSWQRQDFTFKFTPISETYFASYTQTLCRQGILEWSANNFENLAPLVYDQIYCQIGPQHEWLPITR